MIYIVEISDQQLLKENWFNQSQWPSKRLKGTLIIIINIKPIWLF